MIDPSACSCCGKDASPMAMVSDPWMDTCFYVCADCMKPLHELWTKRLFKSLERANT